MAERAVKVEKLPARRLIGSWRRLRFLVLRCKFF